MSSSLFYRAKLCLKQEGAGILIKKGLKFFTNRLLLFIEYIFKFITYIFIVPFSIISFKYKHFESISQMLDFSYGLNGLIKPIQIKEEIYDLLKMLKHEDLKNILEIGTSKGGTLFLLSRISNINANIISIDLPPGGPDGGYKSWRKLLYKSFVLRGQNIHLLKRDSHDKETLNEVKKILNKKKLDLLYIDADHSYEGVKLDFEIYSPLVKKNGYIVFHDIIPYAIRNYGVADFWNSIKYNYEFKEIVKDWEQDSFGIGILKK